MDEEGEGGDAAGHPLFFLCLALYTSNIPKCKSSTGKLEAFGFTRLCFTILLQVFPRVARWICVRRTTACQQICKSLTPIPL
jgi:hypothetical protein